MNVNQSSGLYILKPSNQNQQLTAQQVVSGIDGVNPSLKAFKKHALGVNDGSLFKLPSIRNQEPHYPAVFLPSRAEVTNPQAFKANLEKAFQSVRLYG